MTIQGYQRVFEEMLSCQHEDRQPSQEVSQLIAMGPNECFSQVILYIHQQGNCLSAPQPPRESSFAALSSHFAQNS